MSKKRSIRDIPAGTVRDPSQASFLIEDGAVPISEPMGEEETTAEVAPEPEPEPAPAPAPASRTELDPEVTCWAVSCEHAAQRRSFFCPQHLREAMRLLPEVEGMSSEDARAASSDLQMKIFKLQRDIQ